MSEAKGIQEIKDAVELVLAVASGVEKALADGKIGPEDMAILLEIFPKVGPAFQGAGAIPAEFKDLSIPEAEELGALVLAKLPHVGSEKAGAIAAKALQAAVANYALIQAIRG